MSDYGDDHVDLTEQWRIQESKLSDPINAWGWLREFLRIEGAVASIGLVVDKIVSKTRLRRGLKTVIAVENKLHTVIIGHWSFCTVFGISDYTNHRMPRKFQERRRFSIVKRWLVHWIACLFAGRVRVGVTNLGSNRRTELGIFAAVDKLWVVPTLTVGEMEGYVYRLGDRLKRRLQDSFYPSLIGGGVLYGPLSLVNDSLNEDIGVVFKDFIKNQVQRDTPLWSRYIGIAPTGTRRGICLVTIKSLFVPVSFKKGEEILAWYGYDYHPYVIAGENDQ